MGRRAYSVPSISRFAPPATGVHGAGRINRRPRETSNHAFVPVYMSRRAFSCRASSCMLNSSLMRAGFLRAGKCETYSILMGHRAGWRAFPRMGRGCLLPSGVVGRDCEHTTASIFLSCRVLREFFRGGTCGERLGPSGVQGDARPRGRGGRPLVCARGKDREAHAVGEIPGRSRP